MKRILCILLSVIMVIGVAGCSASEEPEIIENNAVLGQSSSESSSEEIRIPESSESSSVYVSSESESSETSSESKPESSYSSSSEQETSFSSSSEYNKLGKSCSNNSYFSRSYLL